MLSGEGMGLLLQVDPETLRKSATSPVDLDLDTSPKAAEGSAGPLGDGESHADCTIESLAYSSSSELHHHLVPDVAPIMGFLSPQMERAGVSYISGRGQAAISVSCSRSIRLRAAPTQSIRFGGRSPA